MARDHLRIVGSETPWNEGRSYRPMKDEPDVIQALRARYRKPSPIERIADALSSPRFVLFYLGFYAGCLATVLLAAVWSRFL